MKTIKAANGRRESSGEVCPRGHNWPEGSCCVGEQPLDRGSRVKAKGPVKCWKLSATEHLVNRLSQALAGSVQSKQTPPGKKQESWMGNRFLCRWQSVSRASERGSALLDSNMM